MSAGIVAVDWGTTSLRVARLDEHGRPIEEREFPRGILTVQPGVFPKVFGEACGEWMKAPAARALICGMAGSRQGWQEAPYVPCPAGEAEIAARLTWIERGRIAIVPGLTCESGGIPDVMRGEETKALGVLKLLGASDARIVMPGTHCKWVRVRSGRIESFTTCMTGEFYAVLRKHSILARTLPADDSELHEAAFLRGVDYAMHAGGVLHAAFTTRTLSLLGRLADEEAPSYLSGVLIGEELRSQQMQAGDTLILAGAGKLTQRYGLALSHLRVPFRTLGQEATWLGLHAIAQSLEDAT